SKYGLDRQNLLAVGYSNGANIAGSLLLLRPHTLAGAILLRPMVPIVPEPLPDLSGVPVLAVSGRYDAIVPMDEALELVYLVRQAGAEVIHCRPIGHKNSSCALGLEPVYGRLFAESV